MYNPYLYDKFSIAMKKWIKRTIILLFAIIATVIPYPWRIDSAPLGWQKMFYLNPIDYLE